MIDYYKALAEAITTCMQNNPTKCWSVDDLVEAIAEFRGKQDPQNKIHALFIKLPGGPGGTVVYKLRPTAVKFTLMGTLTERGLVKCKIGTDVFWYLTNTQTP